MILADTSVWVDHFRSADPDLQSLLASKGILMHPMVVAELALGSLRDRLFTIALLERLPSARTARMDEVRHLVERRTLYGKGIGLIDAHLLASVLIEPRCKLWTRDKRLQTVANELEIAAPIK